MKPLIQYEPWKVVVTAFVAGAGLMLAMFAVAIFFLTR